MSGIANEQIWKPLFFIAFGPGLACRSVAVIESCDRGGDWKRTPPEPPGLSRTASACS